MTFFSDVLAPFSTSGPFHAGGPIFSETLDYLRNFKLDKLNIPFAEDLSSAVEGFRFRQPPKALSFYSLAGFEGIFNIPYTSHRDLLNLERFSW